MRRVFWPGILVSVFVWCCSGCQSDTSQTPPPGATIPVSGTVIYRGKTLSGGNIIFEPDSGGREAHGTIRADGTYTLTTFKEGDGAARGLHRVAVKGEVPMKYRNVSSSELEVEVVEGKSSYPIDLK